jgi:hypothetical protein
MRIKEVVMVASLLLLALSGGFLLHGKRQTRINAAADAIAKAEKVREDARRNDPRLSRHRVVWLGKKKQQ